MSLRPILVHPDPALRRVCDPVERFGSALRDLVHDMLEAMYTARGRGLAAPQVGESVRLFVIDLTWKEGRRSPATFVNPVVTALTGETRIGEEKCLSIPDTPTLVRRYTHVSVAWRDVDGQRHKAVFDRTGAVVVQHEADHLDGRLCIDLAGPP